KATIEKDTQLDQAVLEIIQNVQRNKDQALIDYTASFDGVKLNRLLITADEFKEARQTVDEDFLASLKEAIHNIRSFHEAQKEKTWLLEEKRGITLGQLIRPLERVGIYVPGGKAGYPSTVVMAVIPAQIAGVEEITITTPPNNHGKVNPHVLAAEEQVGNTKGQLIRPLERVGIYGPGGKAGYPSTVVMADIPAQIAGVEEITITTPPNKHGKVNPYVLAAAEQLGVQKVYKVGGAQAIAAL